MKRSNLQYAKLTDDEDETSHSTFELSNLNIPTQSLNSNEEFPNLNTTPSQAGENVEQPLLQRSHVGPDYYDALLAEKSLLESFKFLFSKEFQWNLKRELAISQHFARLTLRNIKKSKLNFCLGFFACFIVVVIVAVLLTVLGNTPIVFLKLSEMKAGEIDFKANSAVSFQTFNYTLAKELLDADDLTANSVRIMGYVAFTSTVYCSDQVQPILDQVDWRYDGVSGETSNCKDPDKRNCYRKYCTGPLMSAFTYFINSKQEADMGVGRDWPWGPLSGSEILMSRKVADQVGVNEGDTILLRFAAEGVFGMAWFSNLPYLTIQNARMTLLMTVKGIYDTPMGKHSRDIESMIVELEPFVDALLEQLDPTCPEEDKEIMSSIKLVDYADQVIVNIPSSQRMNDYVDSDYFSVQQKVIQFASKASYAIGFNRISTVLPLLPELQQYRIFSIFLNMVITTIIIILVSVCIILVYSLLETSFETRTFEMAVLRMFGMRNFEMSALLLFQALSYALFSYPVGLLVAQLLTIYLSSVLSVLVGVEIPYALSSKSMLLALAISVSIPVVSAVIPIMSVLSSSLSDSLLGRSKTKAVEFSINRSESQSLSGSSIVIGIFLIVFGVAIYYGMPLALVSANLRLLIYLFIALLLGMLLGLTLFAINMQTMVEKFLITVIFFWDFRSVRSLVSKNLVAHKLRNRKTAILYSVSIAFIVYVSVSYQLELTTFLYAKQQQNGCYLKVYTDPPQAGYTSGGSNDQPSIDAGDILQSIAAINDLEEYASNNPNIVGYGWISHSLSSLPNIDAVVMSNVGHYFTDTVNVYAVSPNLFDVTIDGFLNIDSSSMRPLLDSLYSKGGTDSVIVGTTYKKSLGLKLDEEVLFEMQTHNGSTYHHTLNVWAFLDSAPAFTFSQFPQVKNQDILVSMPTYIELSEGLLDSVSQIPMKDFIIKMKDGITDAEIDTIKTQLDSLLVNQDAYIWDYRDEQEPVETASLILGYFFNFTTVVAMVVCFFSLKSSIFNSIYAQTKEIAVLRAIGVKKFTMYRIYIYEALVLVLTSSLFGIFIGTFVGYSMVAQRTLFTQLPIPFVFPTSILTVVTILSLILSILAAFAPIKYLLRMSIVNLFRYVY